MFSILDVFIVIIVLLQSVKWARKGFVQGVFPLVGFWLGLFGGAWLLPHVIGIVDNSLEKLALALALMVGLALVGGALGDLLGSKLSRLSQRWKLRSLDSVLGAVFSAGLTLFLIWILAAVVVTGPFSGINQHLRQSAVLQQLNQHLPPAPNTISQIGSLINQGGFPQVFTGLGPRPVEPVDLPDTPAVRSAIEAAGTATVRLESRGCGGVVSGSGFVIEPGLVMTNAHVVAGIDDLVVVDAAGSHPARPIYFDPDRDIALLRSQNLAGEPLSLADRLQDRGTKAVTLGYPGGGRLDAEPTGILQHVEATGRNIYNDTLVTRSVYELQASIASGNSGGPVVTPDGTVIGMVFARSISDSGTGYALTSTVLASVVDRHGNTTRTVDTLRCA